jgi:hypothetical protein
MQAFFEIHPAAGAAPVFGYYLSLLLIRSPRISS